MLTRQALGRGLSWAGRDLASHPDEAASVVPVAPHTWPCPTNWAHTASAPQQPRPGPLLPAPACPRALPSKVHTRTWREGLGTGMISHSQMGGKY